MDNHELQQRFAALTTAHLADACIRAGVTVRCGPPGLHAVVPGSRVAGRALPAVHLGSVDIFLEAFEGAASGDVLAVDNAGRLDEACVGDLVALEAKGAGLAGIVIWGLHRDTVDLGAIGLPLFSIGSLPTGPQRLEQRTMDPLAAAVIGDWTVTRDDVIVADEDGVLILPAADTERLFSHAESIRDTERAQAERMRGGTPLREQLRFADYLAQRRDNPALTFREHLRARGGAIEE